jgi:hypothetical protein
MVMRFRTIAKYATRCGFARRPLANDPRGIDIAPPSQIVPPGGAYGPWWALFGGGAALQPRSSIEVRT